MLLQQLLIDAVDLLDPTYVRVPKPRRTRLMPIEYGPLPALSEYQRKLRVGPFEPTGQTYVTAANVCLHKLLLQLQVALWWKTADDLLVLCS